MSTIGYDTSVDQETIRDLLNRWQARVAARDVPGIMSFYLPDCLAFDAIGALQFEGREAYQRHWEACFAMCPDGADGVFELQDVRVHVGSADLAYVTYLLLCGGKDEKGEIKTGHMRVTVILNRSEGDWRIAHEHFSVPFDPKSGKALLEPVP